jgi:hypothetical protein
MLTPYLNNWQWQELGFLKIVTDDKFTMTDQMPNNFFEIVYEWLSEGCYLEVRLDEFYLPGRQKYLGSHNLHINMVVGIDMNKMECLIAGYEQDYAISRVTFVDLADAFFRLPRPSGQVDLLNTTYHKRIWKWFPCAPQKKVELGMALIRSQILDYLLGRDSDHRRIRGVDDQLAYTPTTGTWGLKTYDSWHHYLEKAKHLGTPLDLRATRALWEHKQCMVLRVPLLIKNGLRVGEDLIAGLTEVETLAKRIRLLAFAYNTDFQEQSLTDIQDLLRQMQKKEPGLWHQLASALDRCS